MHSLCTRMYVSMYLYSYLSTQGISGLAAHGGLEQYVVRLKMTIEWTQWYTPRPWSSKFGDAIWDRDWVNSEMHWEALIKNVWRCTLRTWSSEVVNALGDRDWVNLEMHFEAVIERVWRCTWRPWLSELRDALAGHDRVSLDMHLEAKIEWTQRCTPSCDRASLWMHLQQAVIEGD